MNIIEKLKQMAEKNNGRLPRNELFECLRMNFKYFDPNEPTMFRMIELACKDLGISMEYEESVLALVNALKGGKVDWEDAWLFVDNEDVAKIETLIDVVIGRGAGVGIRKLRKVTVDGKEYWLCRLQVKAGRGGDEKYIGLLSRCMRIRWPRVLADDGLTTGFIVEEVNL